MTILDKMCRYFHLTLSLQYYCKILNRNLIVIYYYTSSGYVCVQNIKINIVMYIHTTSFSLLFIRTVQYCNSLPVLLELHEGSGSIMHM